ncbi:MAG TPA: AAA family ATPase [Thermoanaerobaculia bacterium]|jgi:chloramphenicol 3-O phosphotransferase
MLVVLNGTSSSGKTSIARAFQEIAPRLFLNFSIDSILYTLPPSVVARLERGEPAPEIAFLELVRGFYACIRELASLGHDLVIDHAVMTRAEAELFVAAVDRYEVLMVGIECPVEVLAERERLRADRRPGLAVMQCERVHRWFAYDLVVDSSRVTSEDAARQIVAALDAGGWDGLARTRVRIGSM